MAYRIVHDLRQKHPEYQVVRHEDLSLGPLQGFRRLYDALGLQFTPKAQRTIQASSSSENPKELSTSAVHAFQLDSRANLGNWKRRLSPEEIQRVRQITGEVAACYYPDESWE
jgi:hypothetical protein